MDTSCDRSTTKSLSTSRASASRGRAGSSGSTGRRAPPSPRPRPNNSRLSTSPTSRSHGKLNKKESTKAASPIPFADLVGDATNVGVIESTLESLSKKVAQLEESNSGFAIKIEKLVEERFNVTMRTSKLHEASIKELHQNLGLLRIEFRSCLERLSRYEDQQELCKEQMRAATRKDVPASKKSQSRTTSLDELQSDEKLRSDSVVDCTEAHDGATVQGDVLQTELLAQDDHFSKALPEGGDINSKDQENINQTLTADLESVNGKKSIVAALDNTGTTTSDLEIEEIIVKRLAHISHPMEVKVLFDEQDSGATAIPSAGMHNSMEGVNTIVKGEACKLFPLKIREEEINGKRDLSSSKSTLLCDGATSIAPVEVSPMVGREVRQLLPSKEGDEAINDGKINVESTLSAQIEVSDSETELMISAFEEEVHSVSLTKEGDGGGIFNLRDLKDVGSVPNEHGSQNVDSGRSSFLFEKGAHDSPPLKEFQEREKAEKEGEEGGQQQQQFLTGRHKTADPFISAKVEAQTSHSETVDPVVEREAHELWLELKKGQWPIKEVEELVNEAVEDGEYTRTKGDAIIRSVYALDKGNEIKVADKSAATARIKRSDSSIVDREIAEFLKDIRSGYINLDDIKLLVRDAARDGEYSLEEAEQIKTGIIRQLATIEASSANKRIEVHNQANVTSRELPAQAHSGEAVYSASSLVDDIVDSEANELLKYYQNGDYKLDEIEVIVQDGITDGDYMQSQGDAILRRVFASLSTELVPGIEPKTPAAMSPSSPVSFEVPRGIANEKKELSFLKNESNSLWAELRITNPTKSQVQAEVGGLVELGEYTESQGGIILQLVLGLQETEMKKDTTLPNTADSHPNLRLQNIRPLVELSGSVSPRSDSSSLPLPSPSVAAARARKVVVDAKAKTPAVRVQVGATEAGRGNSNTKTFASEGCAETFSVEGLPKMVIRESRKVDRKLPKNELSQPTPRSKHRRPPPSHESGKHRSSPQRPQKPGRGHRTNELSSKSPRSITTNITRTSNALTKRAESDDEDVSMNVQQLESYLKQRH